MSLQINQYTKTRTSGTITVDDLIDFDSTDDSGSSYESAKCTVSNLLTYLNANLTPVNVYNTDDIITGNRAVSMAALNFTFTGTSGDWRISNTGSSVCFWADGATGNVGIKAVPISNAALKVTGQIHLTGRIQAGNTTSPGAYNAFINADGSVSTGTDLFRGFNNEGPKFNISTPSGGAAVGIGFFNGGGVNALQVKGLGTTDATGSSFRDSGNVNENLRIQDNGPVVFRSFTVAGVPTVEAGGLIYVSNESGGATLAYGDGVNWRRMSDGAIIS